MGGRVEGERQRIAVIGGGLGALSTVHALTSVPGWNERCEITVYQPGWRLGGKGASSRGRDGRIEEHGLHVWFGFYENAFRMIRDVYGELARPSEHPFARWDQAFSPYSLVVVHDTDAEGRMAPWPLDYPRNDRVPGDPWLAGPVDLVRALARWVKTALAMALVTAEPGRRRDVVSRAAFGTLATAVHLLDALVVSPAGDLAAALPQLQRTARRARGAARRWLGRAAARHRDRHRLWVPIDLALTALYGIARDDLVRRGFEAIDHLDLREWLQRHGASASTLSSAPMRAVYAPGFAYVGGDLDRPSCAAGTMLVSLLRLQLTYAGAYMWRMNAGMGEITIAPLYEVLARRGVRFAFFHRVDELVPEGGRIVGVRLGVQARPKPRWRPLVDVGGVPCWPAEPDWDALHDGEALRGRGARALESNRDLCPTEPLELREGRDFDRVVLGVPIGALPRIAALLCAAEPRWAAALAESSTTATVSAQLWLSVTGEALRWPRTASNMELPLYGGRLGAIDTWADLSNLAAAEAWTEGGPASVHYLCAPWPEGAGELAPRLREFLDGPARELWPGAHGADGFRWDLLHDPAGGIGPGRLLAQVVQVNDEPSDRYVLTLPGSTRHRLAPHDTGFANLTVCGDWTDNGMNLGCVEATVMSGLLASRAICGSPAEVPGRIPRPDGRFPAPA